MIYFAVNRNGDEVFSNYPLYRNMETGKWSTNTDEDRMEAYYERTTCTDYLTIFPRGFIEKLIGKKLSWSDGSYKIKNL